MSVQGLKPSCTFRIRKSIRKYISEWLVGDQKDFASMRSTRTIALKTRSQNDRNRKPLKKKGLLVLGWYLEKRGVKKKIFYKFVPGTTFSILSIVVVAAAAANRILGSVTM